MARLRLVRRLALPLEDTLGVSSDFVGGCWGGSSSSPCLFVCCSDGRVLRVSTGTGEAQKEEKLCALDTKGTRLRACCVMEGGGEMMLLVVVDCAGQVSFFRGEALLGRHALGCAATALCVHVDATGEPLAVVGDARGRASGVPLHAEGGGSWRTSSPLEPVSVVHSVTLDGGLRYLLVGHECGKLRLVDAGDTVLSVDSVGGAVRCVWQQGRLLLVGCDDGVVYRLLFLVEDGDGDGESREDLSSWKAQLEAQGFAMVPWCSLGYAVTHLCACGDFLCCATQSDVLFLCSLQGEVLCQQHVGGATMGEWPVGLCQSGSPNSSVMVLAPGRKLLEYEVVAQGGAAAEEAEGGGGGRGASRKETKDVEMMDGT